MTTPDLQATIIVEAEAGGRSTVTVVAGGGGSAPLRLDWGTESSETDGIVTLLGEVCRRGLTMTTD